MQSACSTTEPHVLHSFTDRNRTLRVMWQSYLTPKIAAEVCCLLILLEGFLQMLNVVICATSFRHYVNISFLWWENMVNGHTLMFFPSSLRVWSMGEDFLVSQSFSLTSFSHTFWIWAYLDKLELVSTPSWFYAINPKLPVLQLIFMMNCSYDFWNFRFLDARREGACIYNH